MIRTKDKTYAKHNLFIQAGGNVGSFITQALLKTGSHTVTALTRVGSTSTIPAGAQIKAIDYEKPESLVEALRRQDALIITLSGHATFQKIEEKLVRAAGEAGVSWM